MGIELINSRTLIEFYKHCQEILKDIMASQLCQFLEYDASSKILTRLDSISDSLVNQKLNGILGVCIEKRQIVEVLEPTKHSAYNPLIDLATNLSLLTVPILDHASQNILALFQVVNLVNNVERSYEKIDWIDKEVIDFLCVIIEKCIKRFK